MIMLKNAELCSIGVMFSRRQQGISYRRKGGNFQEIVEVKHSKCPLDIVFLSNFQIELTCRDRRQYPNYVVLVFFCRTPSRQPCTCLGHSYQHNATWQTPDMVWNINKLQSNYNSMVGVWEENRSALNMLLCSQKMVWNLIRYWNKNSQISF